MNYIQVCILNLSISSTFLNDLCSSRNLVRMRMSSCRMEDEYASIGEGTYATVYKVRYAYYVSQQLELTLP